MSKNFDVPIYSVHSNFLDNLIVRYKIITDIGRPLLSGRQKLKKRLTVRITSRVPTAMPYM